MKHLLLKKLTSGRYYLLETPHTVHNHMLMVQCANMRKRSVQKQIFRVLMLSLTILLVGGGVAAFCLWHQGPTPGHASSDNVVGPPSLPAATVDAIFRRLGSPMVGTGQAVEAASRASNIDDAFALAVWWTETNDGEAGVGRADRNPGSVRGSIGYPSAYDGYTIYPSFTAAVNYWFPMLKRNYINRGLTTVYAISHPYVGTSTSSLWAGKVTTLMNRYRAEAPPPASTPEPTPTLSASLQRVQQNLAHRQHDQSASGAPAPATVSAPQEQSPPQAGQNPGALARQLLVLFALLFALALGLLAWRMHRRSTRLVVPQPLAPSTENLWADLRASRQQPSVFFGQHSLSGLLPTTGDLSERAFNPGAPAMAGSPYTEEPATAGAIQQTPWSAPAFPADPPEVESIEQLPFDVPVTPLAGLPFGRPQDATPLPFQPAFPAPVSNGLRRNRLQPTAPRSEGETSARSPQPVGAGNVGARSAGLLSRYRETQSGQ